MNNISDRLLAYLRSWYATTTQEKASQGVQVDLSFSEFLNLFEKRQLKSLQKAIDLDSLRYLQDKDNAYAYVATWKSYAARSTNVWNKHTAIVCSRRKSAQINLAGPGDKLRPKHKENIRTSLTGKPKSDDHRQNISDGCKGVSKAKWSDERKAERSALRKAQEAAKRAAQDNQ